MEKVLFFFKIELPNESFKLTAYNEYFLELKIVLLRHLCK